MVSFVMNIGVTHAFASIHSGFISLLDLHFKEKGFYSVEFMSFIYKHSPFTQVTIFVIDWEHYCIPHSSLVLVNFIRLRGRVVVGSRHQKHYCIERGLNQEKKYMETALGPLFSSTCFCVISTKISE